jgi:hypothetical protein
VKLKRSVLIAAVLSCYSACLAQAQQIKISTITGGGQSSEETMKLFRQKISQHENLFTLVKAEDASPGLIIQLDCLDRNNSDAAYVCFYTVHYASGTTKSLMGGGVNATKTAEEMATGFLRSLAQDITESMNSSIRTNAVEQLEACLLLTQSSCAVPETLIPELGVKTLNLSQYLQKKASSKAAQQK